MRFERLRRWQWMVIGILLGMLVAFVKLSAGISEPPGAQTTSIHNFENQLIRAQDTSRKLPVQVGLVRLHPTGEAVLPGGREVYERPVITYFVWYPTKRTDNGEVIAEPQAQRIVYDPANHPKSDTLGDISALSAQEYLAKLKNHIQKLDRKDRSYRWAQNFEFERAWLETPAGAYTTFGAAGFVLVGLVWPSILNVLVGAGFGRVTSEDEDKKYLARFRGGAEPAAAKKPVVTDADIAKLSELEADLEARLKNSGLEMTAPVVAAAKSGESTAETAEKAARKFTGAAAEEINRDVSTNGDHKDFGTDRGDYYPTEVHGKQKH